MRLGAVRHAVVVGVLVVRVRAGGRLVGVGEAVVVVVRVADVAVVVLVEVRLVGVGVDRAVVGRVGDGVGVAVARVRVRAHAALGAVVEPVVVRVRVLRVGRRRRAMHLVAVVHAVVV